MPKKHGIVCRIWQRTPAQTKPRGRMFVSRAGHVRILLTGKGTVMNLELDEMCELTLLVPHVRNHVGTHNDSISV